MATAVIGAPGRIGSEIVRSVLARGDAVAALVRDPGKARRAFGAIRLRPLRQLHPIPGGPIPVSLKVIYDLSCFSGHNRRRAHKPQR
jgi:NAD(P)-dependent dehydrogenase (short-subunit alcohol dehydrogenase family)